MTTTSSVVGVSTGDCDDDRPLRAFALIIPSFRAGKKFSNISAWMEMHVCECGTGAIGWNEHWTRLESGAKGVVR